MNGRFEGAGDLLKEESGAGRRAYIPCNENEVSGNVILSSVAQEVVVSRIVIVPSNDAPMSSRTTQHCIRVTFTSINNLLHDQLLISYMQSVTYPIL